MKYKNYTGAVISIIVGILLAVYKGAVVSYVMTIVGIALIVIGILSILGGFMNSGVFNVAIGIIIIICGWALVSIVLYIIAALLIIYGVYDIYILIKSKTLGVKPVTTMILYTVPCLYIAIGCLLMFNQGATIDWVFMVSGILLIVNGCFGLVGNLVK